LIDPGASVVTAAMIFSSVCFVFFIRKAPHSDFRAFHIMRGGDYRRQVNCMPKGQCSASNLIAGSEESCQNLPGYLWEWPG
jgi:hypothetical protein